MSLKATLATKTELDALAEPLRALYVEKDGKYVLDAEGLVPAADVHALKTQVATFRDTNTAVMKERDDLKAAAAKFEGVDPAEYQTLKAEADKLKNKGIKGADDVQALIDAAIAKANKPLVDKLAASDEREQKLTRENNAQRFRELVTADAVKAGATPAAIKHVLREAEQSFELKDGAVVAKTGAKHETAAEWLQDLAKSEAFLFQPSTGSGANGGGGNKSTAKQLINPSPEEMGRNMDAIAKGDLVVVRQ